MLVKNRNRRLGNSFTIGNLPQLQARFANLRETIEVDLNDAPSDPGWQDLLHHVRQHLLALPHIGQPRPSTWVRVRRAIDADPRDIVPWSEFVALCRDQGMAREEDIRQLADYLHNLGDILHFAADAILREKVIFKPTWGLDAVYAVLDNRQIGARQGEFSWDDLHALWDKPVYDGYHVHLLRLMANFQLCYELPDRRDHFIAPQLLAEEGPAYAWDEGDNLHLRYSYPVFMPRGIFSRAVVKLHHRIAEQRLVWRYGVVMEDDYARAEVLELRGEQQIRIRVSGRLRRDLLMEIVRALDELHRGFPRLRFERQIPCNCDACTARFAQSEEPNYYDLDKLLERLANRKETVECNNPPYADVPIRGLLDELPVWDERGREEGGRTFNYYRNVYGGGHHEGDVIDVGNIDDANVAIGRDNQAAGSR